MQKKLKKKLILVDSALNTGGAERILCTIARSLDRDSYDIQIIITGKPGAMTHLVPEGIKFTVLNIRRSRYAALSLAKILSIEKPDAVFVVSLASATACFLARLISRVSFRLSLRYCLMPKQMIKQGFLKVGSLSFRWERFLLTHLEAVIAEHAYMADELKEVFNLDGGNIVPVLNPLDEELMDRAAIDVVRPCFPKGRINIVAAGRLNVEKGFDFLIQSFAEVIKVDRDFHLYIIGQSVGNYEKVLVDIADHSGIRSNVHFEGFQANPFVYFKNCDLFVLSSRWEASPNVLFENLYLGSRIVATDCSPIIKDVIGDSGRIVPWGNEKEMAEAILNYKTYKPSPRKFYSLSHFESAIFGIT